MPFITSQTRGFQSQYKKQRQLFGLGPIESSVGGSHNPQKTGYNTFNPSAQPSAQSASGQISSPGAASQTPTKSSQISSSSIQSINTSSGQPAIISNNDTIIYSPHKQSIPSAVSIMENYLQTGSVRGKSKSRSCGCDRPPKKDIKYIECNPCPCKK